MVEIEIVETKVEKDTYLINNTNKQFIQDLVSSIKASARVSRSVKSSKTIRELAQSCAAASVQALWRGVLVRRRRLSLRKTKSIVPNVVLEQSPDKAALKIQNEWLRIRLRNLSQKEAQINEEQTVGTDCKGIQAVDTSGLTHSDRNGVISNPPYQEVVDEAFTSRLNAINNIYENCLQKHAIIILKRNEMLNILKAMGLLGQKEYEYLAKAEVRDNRSDRTRGHDDYHSFQLTLRGSMMEFQRDLEMALKTLTRIMRTPRMESGAERMMKCAAHGTREDILSYVSLDHYAIRFLYNHKGLDSYSLNLIEDFLLAIGVDGQSIENVEKIIRKKLKTHWTLLNYLKECAGLEERSLMRIKLEIAHEVVLNVSRWELSLEDMDMRHDIKTHTNVSEEKDLRAEACLRKEMELICKRVDALSRENEGLRAQLHHKNESKRSCEYKRDGKMISLTYTGIHPLPSSPISILPFFANAKDLLYETQACGPKIDPMLQPQPKCSSARNNTLKPSTNIESKQRRTILARPKRPSTTSRPTTPKVYQSTTTKSDKQKKVHRVDIQFGNCSQMGKENAKPVRNRKTKKCLSTTTKSKANNTQKKTSTETKKKVKNNDISLSRMMEQSRLKRRQLGGTATTRRKRTTKVAWEDLPSSLDEEENGKKDVLFDDKLTFLGSDTGTTSRLSENERIRYDHGDDVDSLPYRDSRSSMDDTTTSILDETKDEEGVPAMSASMRATTRLNELLDRFRVSALPMDTGTTMP